MPEQVEADRSQAPTSDNKDVIPVIQVCVGKQIFSFLIFQLVLSVAAWPLAAGGQTIVFLTRCVSRDHS